MKSKIFPLLLAAMLSACGGGGGDSGGGTGSSTPTGTPMTPGQPTTPALPANPDDSARRSGNIPAPGESSATTSTTTTSTTSASTTTTTTAPARIASSWSMQDVSQDARDVSPYGVWHLAGDINENGVVLGLAQNTTYSHLSYIHDHGKITVINTGQTGVGGWKMNNAGDVIGITYYPKGSAATTYNFLYRNGTIIKFDGFTPGQRALNEQGLVGGSSNGQAAIYENGKITLLGELSPGKGAIINALNDKGDMAGTAASKQTAKP